MYICMFLYIYMYIYTYTHIHIYVYIYEHINTHTDNHSLSLHIFSIWNCELEQKWFIDWLMQELLSLRKRIKTQDILQGMERFCDILGYKLQLTQLIEKSYKNLKMMSTFSLANDACFIEREKKIIFQMSTLKSPRKIHFIFTKGKNVSIKKKLDRKCILSKNDG